VGKLDEHVAKSKFIPISPYLFHLYHHAEVLNNTKVVAYDTGVAFSSMTSQMKSRRNPRRRKNF